MSVVGFESSKDDIVPQVLREVVVNPASLTFSSIETENFE